MATKGLGDLFMETLQEVYYAEQEILGSLHEMESAAVGLFRELWRMDFVAFNLGGSSI